MVPDTFIFPLGIIEEPMTNKFSLILLLWLLLVSPQLAACAEIKSLYPVQDTGLHAERSSELVWLDNHRLRFYGYRAGEPQGREFHGVPRLIGAGYYIWDSDTNQLVTEPSLEGVLRICAQGDVLTFLRKSPTDENKRLVVTRVKGQENVTPLVNAEWFNRFSCRYYEQKPDWALRGHLSLPLLEEHGSLFWNGAISGRNTPIMFYTPGDTKGVPLPIGTREAWPGLTRYVPFKHAYLLWGYSYIDKATGTEYPYIPPDKSQPIWWLTPDGQVKEQAIPNKSWMKKQEYYAIRDGLFVASRGITDLGDPGVAGGYILKSGTEQKLISGMLENVVVSPDGCKVALIHDPYTKEPFFERINVKVISICEEAHYAR